MVEADRLVRDLRVKRGYPLADFDHRAADISVEHPTVVEAYRSARVKPPDINNCRIRALAQAWRLDTLSSPASRSGSWKSWCLQMFHEPESRLLPWVKTLPISVSELGVRIFEPTVHCRRYDGNVRERDPLHLLAKRLRYGMPIARNRSVQAYLAIPAGPERM